MPLRTVLIISTLLFNSIVYAWGPEGHAIVADIAEKNLTANAQAGVKALLSQESLNHLDDISSWADQVRDATTAPWHFVDIPLPETQYSVSRDCARDACIVAKISTFARQLADIGVDNKTRLEALKWLVHFVGDIHQPLHAEDNDDRGGNDFKLSYFGGNTNLHSIWDGAILENALDLHLGANYSFDHAKVRDAALKLDKQIADDERIKGLQNGILANIDSVAVQWAEESHALAQQAYQQLPVDLNSGWSGDYEKAEWPIVQRQLQKGGLRLAELLNEILP